MSNTVFGENVLLRTLEEVGWSVDYEHKRIICPHVGLTGTEYLEDGLEHATVDRLLSRYGWDVEFKVHGLQGEGEDTIEVSLINQMEIAHFRDTLHALSINQKEVAAKTHSRTLITAMVIPNRLEHNSVPVTAPLIERQSHG